MFFFMFFPPHMFVIAVVGKDEAIPHMVGQLFETSNAQLP